MGTGMSAAGQRFGRLTVMKQTAWAPEKRKFLCQCDCGKQKTVRLDHINSGATQSCGCMQKEAASKANGKYFDAAKTPEYEIWRGMIQRCEDPKVKCYPRYGGRGIRVCDEWRRDFLAFLNEVGRRPTPKHSIDRIQNDGDYEPGNCKWSTAKEQAANRRPPVRTRIEAVLAEQPA